MSENIIDQLSKLAIEYPNDYNTKIAKRNTIYIHEEETTSFRRMWRNTSSRKFRHRSRSRPKSGSYKYKSNHYRELEILGKIPERSVKLNRFSPRKQLVSA